MSDGVASDVYQAPAAPLSRDSEDELLRAAIGPRNTDYYIEAFRRLESGSRFGWNWPAFFFTTIWLLYRKLWLMWLLYAFVLPIGFQVFAALLVMGMGETAGFIAMAVVGIGVFFVLPPLIANAMYRMKIDSLLTKAGKRSDNREEQIAWLSRQGGTSWIGIVLAALMFIGIIAAVALPAYQDYIQNAEMARQLQQSQ